MEISDREHRAKVLAKCIHDGLSDKRSRSHYDQESIAELIEAQMRPLEAAARADERAKCKADIEERTLAKGWWIEHDHKDHPREFGLHDSEGPGDYARLITESRDA